MNPLIISIIVSVVLLAGIGVQTKRLESCQTKAAIFKAKIRQLGEIAEANAKAQEIADKERKEKTDAAHKTAVAGYIATIRRLRDDNASRGFVPPAAPGSASPQRACYPRAGLDAALREFTTETTAVLADLGAAAVDLNSAREWAR